MNSHQNPISPAALKQWALENNISSQANLDSIFNGVSNTALSELEMIAKLNALSQTLEKLKNEEHWKNCAEFTRLLLDKSFKAAGSLSDKEIKNIKLGMEPFNNNFGELFSSLKTCISEQIKHIHSTTPSSSSASIFDEENLLISTGLEHANTVFAKLNDAAVSINQDALKNMSNDEITNKFNSSLNNLYLATSEMLIHVDKISKLNHPQTGWDRIKNTLSGAFLTLAGVAILTGITASIAMAFIVNPGFAALTIGCCSPAICIGMLGIISMIGIGCKLMYAGIAGKRIDQDIVPAHLKSLQNMQKTITEKSFFTSVKEFFSKPSSAKKNQTGLFSVADESKEPLLQEDEFKATAKNSRS